MVLHPPQAGCLRRHPLGPSQPPASILACLCTDENAPFFFQTVRIKGVNTLLARWTSQDRFTTDCLTLCTVCSQGWGSVTPEHHPAASLSFLLLLLWLCLASTAPSLCPQADLPSPFLLLCPSPSFLLCIFGNSLSKRRTGNSHFAELPLQTFPSCSH